MTYIKLYHIMYEISLQMLKKNVRTKLNSCKHSKEEYYSPTCFWVYKMLKSKVQQRISSLPTNCLLSLLLLYSFYLLQHTSCKEKQNQRKKRFFFIISMKKQSISRELGMRKLPLPIPRNSRPWILDLDSLA